MKVAAVAWATVAVGYALISPRTVMPRVGDTPVVSSIWRFVVPPDWLRGARHLARVGSIPGPAFLAGHFHVGRWPYFWPLALAIKLPPTTLVVLALAPLAWIWMDSRPRRETVVVLGIPGALLTLFTLQQQRPIGIRYLLPALVLWIVAASALATRVRGGTRSLLIGVVASVGALGCLLGPSLSWTLPGIGPGYQLVADSNLDWGQSLWDLREWSETHHPWIAYFGVAGIDATSVPGARPLTKAPDSLTGWVAVSVSLLAVYDHHQLAWLRAYCPVEVLDKSVLIYRFRSPPDQTTIGPDGLPPLCAGGTSERIPT